MILEGAKIEGSAAGLRGHNEFTVRVLRAEAFLQMKNVGQAEGAFSAAAQIAPDEGKRAVMQVTEKLLRKSVGLKYVSRSTDEEGNAKVGEGAVRIDLVSMGKRSGALKAFYSDAFFAATAEVEKARGANGVAGFHKALEALNDLSAGEMAVTGKQEVTQKLRDKAAAEMDGAVQRAVAEMMKRADALDDSAKTMVTLPLSTTAGSGRPGTYQRVRGLTSTEARELEGMRTEAAGAKAGLDAVAEKLHEVPEIFTKAVGDAAELGKRAGEVLKGNVVYVNGVGVNP